MKKITLSVGIPAHNEAKNMPFLLKSILSQKQTNFELEHIYVVCDGCTDNTAEVVKKIAKNNKEIILINDGKRKGKAVRLNQIYSFNKSELLMSLDGDVLFQTDSELAKLVREMIDNPKLLIVGPRYVPVKTKTMMGMFAECSYLSFEDAILHLNKGNNIYALMGCATLIRKSLTKKVKYPRTVISDQNYLYLSALKMQANSFKLAVDSKVLFRTVTNFHDWLVLSVRSVRGDKDSAKEFFGEKVFNEAYYMPRNIYAWSLIKWFFKMPIASIGSLIMNIYIRVYVYDHDPVVKGIWHATESSKEAINV